MIKCNFCEEELIWGGDHDYPEEDDDDDGIVSNYSCPNQDCNVEMIVIYTQI